MNVKKYGKRIEAIRCDNCKNIFMSGNTNNGLPNGLGFQMEDGTVLNLCQKCLIKLGSLDEDGKNKFFDELLNKKEDNKDE